MGLGTGFLATQVRHGSGHRWASDYLGGGGGGGGEYLVIIQVAAGMVVICISTTDTMDAKT